MGNEDRRKVILDVAEKLFRHYGPSKMTVADIARAARIGVGTVYLEFRSKDSILGALSARQSERVLMRAEAAWEAAEGSAEERLRAALLARYEAFLGCAKEGRHGAELFHCGSCPAIDEARSSFYARERALFARFLREGVKEGCFGLEPAEVEAEAEALLLALSACAPPLLELHPPPREQVLRLHDLLIRGLHDRPEHDSSHA